MKILFCAYDRPGQIATGPNAWLQRLIPDLRTNFGLEISTLFIFEENAEKCPTLSFFKANELPVFEINKEHVKYVADQVKSLLHIIKENGFTVLVANLVIPAFYAARFLKPFNIPVIGVLHSNDAFYKGVIEKFLKGDPKNQLTAVVSVSKYIDGIAKTEKTEVLYKTIPCGTPLIQESASRTDYRLKIVYAGRLETTQKQILKLTKAFLKASSKNPNLEFSIYGSGSQEQNVKSLIKEFNNPHNVQFNGSVLPSEIQSVMLNHHVFTLMSDYEGMPIALMEAMACGLVPVCLYEESGIDEIISNGVNGFIVQNRDEDYQEQLKIIQQDHYLWKEMSTNAIATIERRFSTDITHKQWGDLLCGFRDSPIKKIKIPNNIKLEGALLHYGDNRKPTSIAIFSKKMHDFFLKTRLFLRPRMRLRQLLNQKKK